MLKTILRATAFMAIVIAVGLVGALMQQHPDNGRDVVQLNPVQKFVAGLDASAAASTAISVHSVPLQPQAARARAEARAKAGRVYIVTKESSPVLRGHIVTFVLRDEHDGGIALRLSESLAHNFDYWKAISSNPRLYRDGTRIRLRFKEATAGEAPTSIAYNPAAWLEPELI